MRKASLKQWEWDDQRATHIQMRHKNVKKCIVNIAVLPPAEVVLIGNSSYSCAG